MKKIWKQTVASLAAILLSVGCLAQGFYLPPSVAAAMELAEMEVGGVYGENERNQVYTHNDFEFVITDGGIMITAYTGEQALVKIFGMLDIKIGDDFYTYEVTAIGEKAFANNTDLETIVVPEGVTSIGDYAFQDCSNLTTMYLPESLTTLGYGVSYNCTNLTDVYYAGSSAQFEAISDGGANAYMLGYHSNHYYNSNYNDGTGVVTTTVNETTSAITTTVGTTRTETITSAVTKADTVTHQLTDTEEFSVSYVPDPLDYVWVHVGGASYGEQSVEGTLEISIKRDGNTVGSYSTNYSGGSKTYRVKFNSFSYREGDYAIQVEWNYEDKYSTDGSLSVSAGDYYIITQPTSGESHFHYVTETKTVALTSTMYESDQVSMDLSLREASADVYKSLDVYLYNENNEQVGYHSCSMGSFNEPENEKKIIMNLTGTALEELQIEVKCRYSDSNSYDGTLYISNVVCSTGTAMTTTSQAIATTEWRTTQETTTTTSTTTTTQPLMSVMQMQEHIVNATKTVTLASPLSAGDSVSFFIQGDAYGYGDGATSHSPDLEIILYNEDGKEIGRVSKSPSSSSSNQFYKAISVDLTGSAWEELRIEAEWTYWDTSYSDGDLTISDVEFSRQSETTTTTRMSTTEISTTWKTTTTTTTTSYIITTRTPDMTTTTTSVQETMTHQLTDTYEFSTSSYSSGLGYVYVYVKGSSYDGRTVQGTLKITVTRYGTVVGSYSTKYSGESQSYRIDCYSSDYGSSTYEVQAEWIYEDGCSSDGSFSITSVDEYVMTTTTTMAIYEHKVTETKTVALTSALSAGDQVSVSVSGEAGYDYSYSYTPYLHIYLYNEYGDDIGSKSISLDGYSSQDFAKEVTIDLTGSAWEELSIQAEWEYHDDNYSDGDLTISDVRYYSQVMETTTTTKQTTTTHTTTSRTTQLITLPLEYTHHVSATKTVSLGTTLYTEEKVSITISGEDAGFNYGSYYGIDGYSYLKILLYNEDGEEIGSYDERFDSIKALDFSKTISLRLTGTVREELRIEAEWSYQDERPSDGTLIISDVDGTQPADTTTTTRQTTTTEETLEYALSCIATATYTESSVSLHEGDTVAIQVNGTPTGTISYGYKGETFELVLTNEDGDSVGRCEEYYGKDGAFVDHRTWYVTLNRDCQDLHIDASWTYESNGTGPGTLEIEKVTYQRNAVTEVTTVSTTTSTTTRTTARTTARTTTSRMATSTMPTTTTSRELITWLVEGTDTTVLTDVYLNAGDTVSVAVDFGSSYDGYFQRGLVELKDESGSVIAQMDRYSSYIDPDLTFTLEKDCEDLTVCAHAWRGFSTYDPGQIFYSYVQIENVTFQRNSFGTGTSVETTTTTTTITTTTTSTTAITAETTTTSSSPAQFLWKLQDITLEPGDTGTYGVDISNAMESYGLQGTLYLPPATRALLQNVDFDNAQADNVYLDLMFSCNSNKLAENGSLGFAFFGATSEIPYHTDGTLFTFDFQVPDADTLVELYHQYGLSIEDGCLVFPVQWKELGYDYVERNGELVPFARYGYLDRSVTDCFDDVVLEDGAIRVKLPDGLIVEESTTTTEIISGSPYVASDSLTVSGGDYHAGDTLELHIQYDERLHGDCYIRITNDEATSKLLVQENVLLDDLYTYTFDRDYSGDLHIDIEFRYTGDSQHSLTIADVSVSRGTGTTTDVTTASTNTSISTNTTAATTVTTATTNHTETGYYVVLGKPEQDVLTVGSEVRLLFNSNASNLIWSSSDSEIVSVDQNGVVSIHGSGNVTIYAVVKEDPSKIASVTLNIPGSQITVDRGDVTRDGVIGLDDAYAILMFNSYQAIGVSYNFTDGSNSELEQLVRQAADVDNSGVINLRDAYSTLMYNSYQSIGTPNLTWDMVIA